MPSARPGYAVSCIVVTSPHFVSGTRHRFPADIMSFVNDTLQILRNATRDTPYEGRLYLVGGYVRDKLLDANANPDDIDLVLEGDALEAARFLWKKRVTDHAPVEYGQFGTTQVE